MTYTIAGVVGFLLFVLYDINSVLWRRKSLHCGFFAGNVLIIGATIMLIKRVWNEAFVSMGSVVWGLLALFFLGLLIYTLFFALPFGDTYQTMGGRPQVCSAGVYALCRHPGVLWFFFFYLFLGLSLHSLQLMGTGMVLSLCNLGYVILQDMWTFPRSLGGYEEYKKSTPFLIPTKGSIMACLTTLRQRGRKEHEV